MIRDDPNTRVSPVTLQVVQHAQKGKFVLGICNVFQVLTAGLLPGALVRNRDLHFVCDRVPLKVEGNHLPWTQGYAAGEIITLPIAHGEGQFYADKATPSVVSATLDTIATSQATAQSLMSRVSTFSSQKN